MPLPNLTQDIPQVKRRIVGQLECLSILGFAVRRFRNQARQHFEWWGYWEGRRYFYYPYEKDGENGSGGNNNQGELVFSTTNGLPVLYKDEKGAYNWSSNLDGIVLWTVVANEGGDKSFGTAKFIDGHILYGFDTFSDDVADFGTNKVTYTIDENGFIKSLEGDGEYQYYNAIRLEHGGIGTIQNDQGPASVADNGTNVVDQWFFASKEIAQAFLNGTPIPGGATQTGSNVVVEYSAGIPVVVKNEDTLEWYKELNNINLWLVGHNGDELITFSLSLSNNTIRAFEGLRSPPDLQAKADFSMSFSVDDNGYLVIQETEGPQYFRVTGIRYTDTGTEIETLPFETLGEAFTSDDPSDYFFTSQHAAEKHAEFLSKNPGGLVNIYVSGGQNTSAPPYYVLKDAVGNLAGGAFSKLEKLTNLLRLRVSIPVIHLTLVLVGVFPKNPSWYLHMYREVH